MTIKLPEIPDQALNRAGIASLLLQTGAVLESYRDTDGIVHTFAFVEGVPIPIRTYIMLVVCRWYPHEGEAEMKQMIINDETWLRRHIGRSVSKDKFVTMLAPDELCNDNPFAAMSQSVSNNKLTTLLISLVEHVHEHIMTTSEPAQEYKDMVRRIDEDYENSLLSPVELDA